MRVLFLSAWFPVPADNGSKLRILNLLQGLATKHEVTLLSFARTAVAEADLAALQSVCEEAHVVAWREFRPESRRARLGFLSKRPRSIVDTFSPEMASCIETLCTRRRFDLIIASQLPMAAYAPHFGTCPALFEELELTVLHEKYATAATAREQLRQGLMWYKQRTYVQRLLRRFALCTVASAQERALAYAIDPRAAIEIVPNCVDLAAYQNASGVKAEKQLIFSGSLTYSVNYEAMVWFLEAIYPIIQQQVPNVQLVITGDHGNLPLPAAANVRLPGYLPDIKQAIAGATISIVPLLQGGGTRLKILEAMALHTAVVSTTKGAEGLDGVDGQHLLLADDPANFAEAVVRLLDDAALRNGIADNAHRLVAKKYDWTGTRPRFLDLVERAAITEAALG